MMKLSGIYQIENLLNGKRYVGSAKNMYVRMSKHVSSLNLGKHHARYLQASASKHGIENFVFTPLLVCAPEDLLFYEQRALDTLKPEYNSSPTAGNTLGVRISAERKAKISAALTGRKLSEAHKRSIALGGTGRKHSEESLEKMSHAQLARPRSEAELRGASERAAHRNTTEYMRTKVRESKLGKPANLPEESRIRKNAKIGAANRTRIITESHRANAAAAQKQKLGVPKYLYTEKEYTMLGLSDLSGLGKATIRHRLQVMGWDVSKAVETPSRKRATNA